MRKRSSPPVSVAVRQTIGFYIPVPKKPSQSERDALLEAGRRMREEMERLGITEDELVAGSNSQYEVCRPPRFLGTNFEQFLGALPQLLLRVGS